MRNPWILAGIVVLAVTVRLVVFWIDPHSDEPSKDSKQYHNLAWNLVERGTLSTASEEPYRSSARRGPGYPLFLAAIYSVAGPNVYAAKLVQCVLLGPAMCVLAFLIVQRALGNHRIGLLTAAAVAIMPPVAEYCDRLMTEALFTVLLLGAIYATYRWIDSQRPALAILCGVVWGAMALVKPESALLSVVVIPAAVLASDAGKRRQTAVQGLVAVLAVAGVIAPWIYRNHRVLGKPTLQAGTVEERGGIEGGILHRYRVRYEHGLTFRPSRDPFRFISGDNTKQAEEEYQAALNEPVADPSESDIQFWLKRPGAVMKYTAVRLVSLLRPASWSETFGLDRDFRQYIKQKKWLSLGAKGGMLLLDAAVTIAGLVGLLISLRPTHMRLWVITASVAYFLAVYGLLHGVIRYRVPFIPLLILLGVWWLYCLAQRLRLPGRIAETN